MDISRLIGCVFIQLCLVVLHCSAIRPPYPSDRSRNANRIKGEWGKWGAWSSCSVECGTGISSRTRRCEHPLTLPVASLIIRADDSVICEGGGREIRVCNRHRCPPNVENVREKQCRKFNARVFNGKKYKWEPYINPNNKCELTCRAKGQHFYARLANRVGDGTPCGLRSLAVCIHRKCLNVGCDGLVGSDAKLDICGVCKGDNSTCRKISGVFTRPDLPHGYSKIITIPTGSTNINITELRPSTNYLSLKTNTQSIINANWAISSSGDYDAAGTTFAYKKESVECPGECLFAPGPTNETLELMMLVYHKNPGVVYSFNVPVNVTNAYFKDLISHSEEKHHHDLQTTTTTTTTTLPELANLELQGPAEVDLDVTEVEDVTEAFREELLQNQDQNEDLEEGVLERPQTQSAEEEVGDTYGDRGYTFHEGNGQTVVLKANAGSWLYRSNESESQSQEGPKFVLSELESNAHQDGGDDTSLEVVDGDAVLAERKTESEVPNENENGFGDKHQVSEAEMEEASERGQMEGTETIKEEGAESNVEDSEELQEGGIESKEEDSVGLHQDVAESKEEDSVELHKEGAERNKEDREELYEEGESNDANDGGIVGTDDQERNEEEEDEMENEEETGFDQDGETFDQKSDELSEGEVEEPYDKSRGDETLGLGDGYVEPVTRDPILSRRGYRIPNRVGVDMKEYMNKDKNDTEPEEVSLQTKPTKTAPTSTEQYTAPSSTVPQRDSRFRTYSRTLGQSDVRPTIKRIGRPVGRPGRRGNVRIPKYSQSFTFRERYRALINAQRKERLYRQRQQFLAGSSASTNSPLKRPISSRSQTGHRGNSQQRTNLDRSLIQPNTNRGASSTTTGRGTIAPGHHNRHRHHHQQPPNRPVITTSPTLRRIDNTNNRQSEGLHIGRVSESRSGPGHTRKQGSSTGQASSVTLQANVDSQTNQRRPPSGQRQYGRDHRLSHGYQDRRNQTSNRYHQQHRSQIPTGRQQPFVNTRVTSQPFDRAIDPRQSVPDPYVRPQSRKQESDSRRIVDETLALGQFDRATDPRPTDRRIVIPQQPVGQLPTGRQVINQQPVINAPPRYDNYGSNNGEPLARYAGGIDPVSGLPSISSADTQSLRGGRSFSRNVIPTNNRQRSSVAAGGQSNEILISTYVWRVSGFSDCTMTCGGGVQQTVVVCVDTRTQAVVTDENCGRLRKPTSTAVTCNTRPCPASWESSPWGSCSATCGQGIQSRTVTCKSRVSATLNLTMPGDSCSQEKPPTVQSCEITPCYRWVPGNWTKCSSRCGQGKRQRDVTCVDAGDNVVTSQLCTDIKPANEENCDMGSCGKGWFFTKWPEECPASCGEGTMNRKSFCAGEDGDILDEDRCDKLNKPEVEKTCRVDTPCGGNWFVGEWSKCNGTCGYAVRYRDVVCVKNLPGGILAVVTDDNCKGKEKPETGEECDLSQCEPEWYMTSWSQCSKTCGTGHRTREVKCLDPYQQPSGDCPTREKPRTREPCNTQSCVSRPRPTNPTGGSCTDSFSQCKLVKKARLCRYGYYAKMCCLSCSNET